MINSSKKQIYRTQKIYFPFSQFYIHETNNQSFFDEIRRQNAIKFVRNKDSRWKKLIEKMNFCVCMYHKTSDGNKKVTINFSLSIDIVLTMQWTFWFRNLTILSRQYLEAKMYLIYINLNAESFQIIVFLDNHL